MLKTTRLIVTRYALPEIVGDFPHLFWRNMLIKLDHSPNIRNTTYPSQSLFQNHQLGTKKVRISTYETNIAQNQGQIARFDQHFRDNPPRSGLPQLWLSWCLHHLVLSCGLLPDCSGHEWSYGALTNGRLEMGNCYFIHTYKWSYNPIHNL